MYKLICRDFGFDCAYTIYDEYDVIIDNFIKHAHFSHGVQYSKRSVLNMLSKNKVQNISSGKNETKFVSYGEVNDEFRLEKWNLGHRNFP